MSTPVECDGCGNTRQSLKAIRQIRITAPSGGQVPLAQVADIRTATGVSFIHRESTERYVPDTSAL
jgi:Cu/Ag efflux pump CusA